ncbi:MAG: hypothetical protein DYG95_17880 [Chlorobi bacterium CHB1]|nr:hypothetical protein [Chlorobi bacterium CHB1]
MRHHEFQALLIKLKLGLGYFHIEEQNVRNFFLPLQFHDQLSNFDKIFTAVFAKSPFSLFVRAFAWLF